MASNCSKFVFFAPADIQVARVDRQCIVYACEALQRLGIDVELVALKIKLLKTELKGEHPLSLYRCRTPPTVRLVRSLVRQESSAAWCALNRLVAHAYSAVKNVRETSGERELVFYTKNYASVWVFVALRKLFCPRLKVVFEAHTIPHNAFQRLALQRVDGIIANSFALEKDLAPYVSSPMIGLHQGVDLEQYNALRISKEEARQKVGLSPELVHVIYTGKVFWGYREVEHLLSAALKLDAGIQLTIVGGRHDHAEKYKRYVQEKGLRNVRVVGFVPPREVQWYQLAADVLLSYYPTGIELNRYRSPGKLFEYLAAGRAIIAADYSSLREVMDESMGIFVPPDAPDELACQINALARDPERIEQFGRRALERATEYTWDKRADRILKFIRSLSPAQAVSTPLLRCVESQEL